MTTANSQFFAILTAVGEAKQANANALGVPWTFSQLGVGDANLTDPVPSREQTRLINERRRAPLNQLKVDPANPNLIVAEQVIPPDVGGWWIREIGLYDADGDLVAVANCAPSFKPLLNQGTGKTQVVRLNIIVTSTANVQLKIDPAVVLATRSYVDAAILDVLPKNKTPGEYTRVKINDRGLVVSGDNPTTLAGNGISDAYTKEQVDAIIAQASALPVGAMVAFPVDKVAPGFLEVDGSVKSVAAYPDLAAFLGTTFNKGDEGAGNFRLPESRAEFFRGWDHGRGVDAGRAVGSYQLGSSIRGVASNSGAGGGPANLWNNTEFDGLSSVDFYPAAVSGPQTEVPTGVVRPRNLAVMWCIKAWNAPINQGQIDIAALAVLAGQATEQNQGTAKIATDVQMLDSTNDQVIVTPKKFRKGFAISLTANGYIAFPGWLGGLILQWGQANASNTGTAVAWPMAFPSALFSLQAMHYGGIPTQAGSISASPQSLTGATFVNSGSISPVLLRYVAIGF
ncbi:Phage Tail Collar Domain protein [compost metagenome]